MDPPPLSAAQLISTNTTVAQPNHISYPNSVDSSPRSRTTESFDEPTTLPSGPTTKLRLMCSYGGHIIPRPHDKTLCYIGGDTRIIVVDRHTTLSGLHNRLSKTLLNNKPFTLKYQLPNEDLDSLISVTTDEDLENMIDEYDRLFSTSGVKLNSGINFKSNDISKASPSRLRLFLFPLKSESSETSVLSIESLLESSTKSEDWFLDALNGNMRQSSKCSSDSSSVNCLLGLEDHGKDSSSMKHDKHQGTISNNNINNNNAQDVHSVPDSPMLDTTSSFGSTSSSPSMTNFPPIRVHVEESGQEQKVGGLVIEEQFQQMSVGFTVGASPPAPVVGPVVNGVPEVVGGGEYVNSAVVSGGEYVNRVFSDDERSEQGAPIGYRKVPQVQPQVQLQQQLQPTLLQQKPSGAFDLPSPDSVSSEGSVTNPLSRQRQQMAYQEHIMQIQSANNRAPANLVDPMISDPNNRVQMQQLVQEPEYVIPGQFDQLHQQQQFVHAGVQYIHPHAAGGVPLTSYYPVYPSQQQHNPHHPALEQQYVYYVPARQAQVYNVPVQQQNYSESPTAAASSRPQTPPATLVNPAVAYSPAMNAPASKPEMAPCVYRTPAAGGPQLVQVHSSQHQPQFVGYPQMHHPSQSVPPASGAAANYTYEYADPSHAQIYYPQQPIAQQFANQYQTVTSAPGMVLPRGSSKITTENIKQQNSNSQP